MLQYLNIEGNKFRLIPRHVGRLLQLEELHAQADLVQPHFIWPTVADSSGILVRPGTQLAVPMAKRFASHRLYLVDIEFFACMSHWARRCSAVVSFCEV
jgi:hypothetical protein